MREESHKSFQREDEAELIQVYIESELKEAGIVLQQINIDGTVITVTTDKNVPEKTMSNIRQYAASKGISIKFLTSR